MAKGQGDAFLGGNMAGQRGGQCIFEDSIDCNAQNHLFLCFVVFFVFCGKLFLNSSGLREAVFPVA